MNRSDRGQMTPEVTDAFRFSGDIVHMSPLRGGHIHRNYLVTCGGGRYVLQQLNDVVFPDIVLVLSNVERVVAHLSATGRCGPELVATRDGALSFRSLEGTTWRAFHFLEGTVSGDTLSRPDVAYEAGRSFADYRVALTDLPGPPLAFTIERFHDLPHRMARLDAVAAADPVGRRSAVDGQIDRAQRLGATVVDELATRARRTPVRTVHNDAKLSNLRFDAINGRAVCVVDFDTTMPGSVRHDVGELVRTTTSYAPEDASDEAGVDFDLELFDALSAGYLARPLELEPSEIDSLAVAGPEMAIENGLRFLTDHVAGDRYFAVDRPGQNLDRCRTQLRLTELMLDAVSEVDAIVSGAARKSAPAGPVAPPRRGSTP
jgi:N-acetylhexosamine 1-kinase